MRLRPAGFGYPFWLLVLITGSGTLPVHIFVPALPFLAAEFGIDGGAAQLTTSAYLFALALGQVAYGPLSDRFGRRPVLLAGLALYAAGSVGAAMAVSYPTLIAARVLQALGGCVGLVLGRAIIHDTAHGSDAVARVALLNTVLLVSPSLAPTVGLWLAGWFGWRAIPMGLATVGTVTAIGSWLLIKETARERIKSPRDLAAGYLRLLRTPRFMAFVLGGSLGTTVHFALLSAGPFIVADVLGRPLSDLGFFYGAWIVGLIVGGLAARWLVPVAGINRMMMASTVLSAASGTALLVLAGTGRLSALTLAGAGTGFMIAAGLLAPLSLNRAIAEGGKLIGSASGIYGCVQMLVGALAITVASAHSDLALSAGALLAFGGVGALVLLGWAIASGGETGGVSPRT